MENHKEMFEVAVWFRKRTHRYKVTHQRLKKNEAVFTITTGQRTIEIKAVLQKPETGSEISEWLYTYEEESITNKALMNKIIDAIVTHIKNQNKND